MFKSSTTLSIIEASLWIIGVIAALIFFVVKINSWGPLDTPEQSDFAAYYLGARVSQEEPASLYRDKEWPEIHDVQPEGESSESIQSSYPYLYVPTFAWALRPLSALSYETARRVWFWGGILAILISAIGLLYMKRLAVGAWGGLMLWILLPATLDNIHLGQIDAFLTPLVIFGLLGLCASNRWKQFSGGFLISLAGVVKLFPLSLIVLAPWGRKWFYGVGWIAGFIALPPSVWIDFSQILGSVAPPLPDRPILHNQSIFCFWNHFAISATIPLTFQGNQLGSFVSEPVISRSLALILSYASVLLILAFAATALRKFYQHRDLVFAWTLVFITVLIVAPVVWWHYAMIAAPMFVGIVKMRACASRIWRLLLPLGYLLIVVERAKAIYLQFLPHLAFSSLMLFGLLLWWFVFVVYALRIGRDSSAANPSIAAADSC